ncbi:MAG: hypothetical protein S4CHLAM37_06140 [Chlamydiia bacterium]|nr:hypothetical protein [Chlamydiia bacterium]
MTQNPLANTSMKNHCQTPKKQNFKAKYSIAFQNKMQQKSAHDKRIGESFFKQGELKLLHGDSSGIQFFDLSLQLDPQNTSLLFNQGLSLLEFSTEKGKEKFLQLAAKRFKAAVQINPSYFEAWQAWGSALYTLGKITEEHHYLLESETKYKKALSISKGQAEDVLADLHWNYANVWSNISKRTKEPSDMKIALEAYQKAQVTQNDQPIEFWHDFGHICLELGFKMNDLRYFIQSINCYKNAVSISISSFDSWMHLSHALSSLYGFTHDEDHFTQANECFSTAAQLQSKDAELWFNWAKILTQSAKMIQDPKRARSAIEKCHRAFSLDPNDPFIISTWSEALSLLGTLNDKVGNLYEAQNKISQLLEEEEHPEFYYSYGYCLFCLGVYFGDVDYYYQAIEKFQEGLSIDRTYHRLWHALAYTFTKIGLIEDNNQVFERAHKFYQKAIAIQGNSLYYFDYAFSLYKFAEFTSNEKTLEIAKSYFEQAINLQKNAIYLHPDWLFHYGLTLEALATTKEDKELYSNALEVLNHVLMVDPEYPKIHYHLASCLSHSAELELDANLFAKALHHYRLAHKREEDDDQLLLDWALCLVAYADGISDEYEKQQFFKDAEFKMTQAAKLGNTHAYFHLACLYSLLNQLDKAMHFVRKAEEYDTLPEIEDLLEDDWLETLRNTENFQNFLTYLEEKSNIQE